MTPKVCVYSSIGDISNGFYSWSAGQDDDYICASTYYKNDAARALEIKKHVNFFNQHSGSKMQNFSRVFETLPTCDWYVLTDDDIHISKSQILQMIATMEQMSIKVGSPSHSPNGRISWRIMRTTKKLSYRLTNFVEMTIMILHRDEVIKFLNTYRPYADTVIDWGCDCIVQSVCTQPFIIFDNVSVINPTNLQKNILQRENEDLGSDMYRARFFYDACKKSNGIIREDVRKNIKLYRAESA